MNTPAPRAGAGKPRQDVAPAKPRLVEIFAERYHVEPEKLLATLRATCFSTGKDDPPATNEEMMALLVVANQYNLNPFTREIYAFRKRTGGIVPIVGIDGWTRIVEAQPTFEGEQMRSGYDETLGPDEKPLGFYYECLIYRSDRKFPVCRRQYYRENVRNTDPWSQMPTRMLQHRAYIQSARAAFGFGGIYEPEEGEVIALSTGVDLLPTNTRQTLPPQPKQKPAEDYVAPQPERTKTETWGAGGGPQPPELAGESQLEHIRERLAVTGVPDNLVLARFELGRLEEIPADQVPDVLKFIADNAP